MIRSKAESKIKRLPEALTNKIAAGEVVERPSAVVKELVENSLDAGATRIDIVINSGGKKLIQVIDNGSGIPADELELAFERHATSKINIESDLEAIKTLGFRGEALASISAVSQTEIKTKTYEDISATIINLSGGQIENKKKTAANAGTSVSVKNLFFNTPARRKFLRSENSENQHILNTLKRFFLSFPKISFSLTIDNKSIFNFLPQTWENRVKDVFGTELNKRLLYNEQTLGGIKLSGFIIHPESARKSKTHQHLFLNNRPVFDRQINYAIYQGYGETLEPNSHPAYCLKLDLDPKLVDVNIHPTKMQVRFTNDQTIFYLFLNFIKRTLNEKGILQDLSTDYEGSAIKKVIIDTNPQKNKNAEFSKNPKDNTIRRKKTNQLSLTYFSKDINQAIEGGDKETVNHESISENVRLIQIHSRYILSQIKSGLVFIDQHLAHARILYEKNLRILQDNYKADSQKLLFPQKITLALDDFLIFKDIQLLLNKIGFEINVFSGNTIIIDSMPSDVKIGRESQIFLDVIDFYKTSPSAQYNLNEKISAAFSFKNAIKPGEILQETEMQSLIDQLFACDEPFFAPNGRPAVVIMDLKEIKSKFEK